MTVGFNRSLLMLAIVAALVCAGLLALAKPGSASAHPLGNFTVNRYSRIEVYSDVVRVQYVLDMAEIPTFQQNSDVDTDSDGAISAYEAQSYADATAPALLANLNLSLDGERADLAIPAAYAAFPEGQGGLPTTRLTAVFETPAPSGTVALAVDDANYSDRVGWREIVVSQGTGAELTGDYPTQDISQALTAYPGDLLSSPLDRTSVALSFNAAGAVSAPGLPDAPADVKAPQRAGAGFVSLISGNDLTFGAVLLALLAAFAFGALHAVEPGHGKTLVAAYFVGVKGTVRQALGLGIIVAVTHTVGVLAIGLIAIFGSQWILPENLYPWLSLISGLMVMALGVRLILARGGGRLLHRLSHLPGLGHHHHHDHAPSPTSDGIPPWRTLIGIGLADGLTPSPSALVVLLAAVSLHRIGLGIALIVAFSVGLAVVLAGISLGLLFFKQAMDAVGRRAQMLNVPLVPRIAGSFSAEGAAMRVLPLTGAFVLVAVGIALTLRALGQPGMSL